MRHPSISLLLHAALVALLFAFTACGDSGSDPDAAPLPPVFDASQATERCSFENCDGCCQDGQCVEELSQSACGLPGQECQTCSGDQLCTAGQCVTEQNCDDCDGCCFEGTQCLPGNTVTACGKDGAACAACSDSQGCSAETQTCEAKVCDATNCEDGCCTANGDCVPFGQQELGVCGKDGAACSQCNSGDLSCTLGTCVADQPCLDFCDQGCCTPQGQCILFADQEANQCGTAETCMDCGGELSCVGGACTADPAFTVTIVSTVVAELDPDGEEWDTTIFTNPLPDPYVGGALSGDNFLDGLSPTIDNTRTPNWNYELGTYLQSDLVNMGLSINIRDSDGVGIFETIGNCTFTITAQDLANGTKTQATCGTSATDLRIDFAEQ